MTADAFADRPSSSLLDRLIHRDDREQVGAVGISQTSVTGSIKITRRQLAKRMSILREQIERDLLALMGTRRMSANVELADWPWVNRSVINYGVPDLSGTSGSGLDLRKLQHDLTAAIKTFEPRLRPQTLKVKCRLSEYAQQDVLVQIEALFGPADALESFAMEISLSLGSGQCRRLDGPMAA